MVFRVDRSTLPYVRNQVLIAPSRKCGCAFREDGEAASCLSMGIRQAGHLSQRTAREAAAINGTRVLQEHATVFGKWSTAGWEIGNRLREQLHGKSHHEHCPIRLPHLVLSVRVPLHHPGGRRARQPRAGPMPHVASSIIHPITGRWEVTEHSRTVIVTLRRPERRPSGKILRPSH